jgi:hypothetical protein
MTTTILTDVTTAQGNTGWRYVGREDRNREPEITAVDVNGPPRRLRSACHKAFATAPPRSPSVKARRSLSPPEKHSRSETARDRPGGSGIPPELARAATRRPHGLTARGKDGRGAERFAGGRGEPDDRQLAGGRRRWKLSHLR